MAGSFTERLLFPLELPTTSIRSRGKGTVRVHFCSGPPDELVALVNQAYDARDDQIDSNNKIQKPWKYEN
jgi:hypothetical protein